MEKDTQYYCLKACYNRNKYFRNIKDAVDFGLVQVYLIYIIHRES